MKDINFTYESFWFLQILVLFIILITRGVRKRGKDRVFTQNCCPELSL